MSMRILHVYKDFDPPVHGGIERHIALMCRYQRQWAEVEALICSGRWRGGVREHEGVRIHEAGEWGRFQSAPLAPAFPWHLKRLKADVVVLHSPNPTAEVSWLLTRPHGALIVRYHSDVVRQARAMRVYGPILERFLGQAACIIPTSPPYLETSPFLQKHRDRCAVVPLGIVPEDFPYPGDAAVEALQARYGGPFVLFTGRHRYYKGLRYLVAAAKFVDAPIVIAGDGPERAALEAQAQASGVSVHFPGSLSQSDLVAHLHGCALFAFPSIARSEAFGISIMEAHVCGKPVVATKLGTGVEYINEDGKTGLNVTPEDSSALADALNTLLRDDARRTAMGHYAQTRILRDFRAEKVAQDEFQLYQKALECSNSRS